MTVFVIPLGVLTPGDSFEYISYIPSVRLDIPTVSMDGIVVGVCMEEYDFGSSSMVKNFKPKHFSRFVSNNTKHSQLIYRFMKELGKILITFTNHAEDGLWAGDQLHFEFESFLVTIVGTPYFQLSE